MEYIIIIRKDNGKRESSLPLAPPVKNLNELITQAKELFPDEEKYFFLNDKTGEIQAQLTNQNTFWLNNKVEVQPSDVHDWNGSQWVINPVKQAEKLQIQRQQVWELIKQERTKHIQGGVYIESIDKWFHTDRDSRTQYLALQQQKTLPPNLQWKTMDNTFVALNADLVDLVIYRIIEKEQSDFQNAEIHRLAVEKSEDPINYDFSTGWSAIYGE